MTSLTANQNSNCNQSSEAIVWKVLTDPATDTMKNNAEAMSKTSVAQDVARVEWAGRFSDSLISMSWELCRTHLGPVSKKKKKKVVQTPLNIFSSLATFIFIQLNISLSD